MPKPKPPLTVKNFITRVNTLINAAKKWSTLTAEDAGGEGVDLMAIVVEYHRCALIRNRISALICPSSTKFDVKLTTSCVNVRTPTWLDILTMNDLLLVMNMAERNLDTSNEREREYFGLDEMTSIHSAFPSSKESHWVCCT
jgi:hypothetical protein